MNDLKRDFVFVAVLLTYAAIAGAQTPVANVDAYTALAGSDLVVEAPGVLDNDRDDQDEDLPGSATAELVSDVSRGTLTLGSDGGFTYTYPGSFTGTDTFTYRVVDGAATSNTATVTITVTGCEGGPTLYVCWVESSFVAKLTELSIGSFTEGFEDGAAWGPSRSPDSAPSVLSQGINWTANNGTSEITTGSGPARTGGWGVYADPHGNTTGAALNPQRDGWIGTAADTLYGVGGWLTSNTSGAQVRFLLDGGTASEIVATFPDGWVTSAFKFFGVIDTTGFDTFEIHETEGVVEDQKYIFADDFTIGGSVPVNGAPTAVGDAATVAEGGTVTILDSSASSVLTNDGDPEGDTLTAVWASGPSHGTLTLNTNGTFSYTHDDSETFTDSFQYRANDGLQSSNLATVSISITPVNDNAPTAEAGPGQSVFVNDPVTLDGSASSDVDGDTLTYSWTITSKPAGSAATLTNPSSLGPTFTVDVAGSYTIQLVVNDGLHDSAPDTVVVEVANDSPNMTGVVAGVADIRGLQGSDWHTDLYLHNASPVEVEVEIYFSPSRGTVGDPVILVVGGDTTVALDDVVSTVFGVEGSGAIFWRVVAGDAYLLMVSANTYNRVDDVLSFGQQVIGVRWDDVPASGESLVVPAVAGPFRTNLGFSTDGSCTQVRVRGYDRFGSLEAERTLNVKPHTWRQLNQLFRSVFPNLITDPDTVSVSDSLHRFEVEGVDGKVVVYTSIIDNVTNDGSYMLGQWVGVTGDRVWLPGAAFTRGINNSQWRSDVVAMNLSGGATTAQLTYYPSGGDNGGALDSRGIDMAEDEGVFQGNILRELFELSPPAVGTLGTAGGHCLYWMRTYTEEAGENGFITYGQAVLPHGEKDTITVGAEGRIYGFSWDDHTRSNLIFQNTLVDASGNMLPVNVRVQLLDKQGIQVHQTTYPLRPGEYLQHNGFLKDFGVGWVHDGALRVVVLGTPEAGQVGGVLAMVSEVNGAGVPGTNDGRLLTAVTVSPR